MATTKTLLPAAYQTLEDINGYAIASGTVTFKVTGTAVLAVVYADADGLVISPNPVVVDAAGRYSVWLTPGDVVDIEYRDALGTLIKTVPGVMAMPGSSGNVDVTGLIGDAMVPGQFMFLADGTYGTAGQWWATNNIAAAMVTCTVGVALTTTPSGSIGTLRIAGRVTGLSGLVVGQRYYLTNVGYGLALTVPPGTYGRLVGQADTTTSLILWPNPPDLDAPNTQAYTGTGVVAQLVPTARTVTLKNATLLTIQGIKAGYHGQRLRLLAWAASAQVDFVHNSPAAAAADRVFNHAASAPTSITPGANGSGRIDYEYDATIPGWVITAHEQGGWITPAFNAAHYTGSGAMTWVVVAGNVGRAAYYLQGKALRVQLVVFNSTLGGVADAVLLRVIPGGFTAGPAVFAPVAALNNGAGIASAVGYASGTQVGFRHDFTAGSLWVLGPSCWIGADMTMEVA